MRLKLISCDLYARALAVVIARTRNKIYPEFIKFKSKQPQQITDCINSIISNVKIGSIQAILILGCKECLRSLQGITAVTVPIVLPKRPMCGAHLPCKYGDKSLLQQSEFNNLQNESTEDITAEKIAQNLLCQCCRCNDSLDNVLTISLDMLLDWEKQAEAEAEWFGWDFEKMPTDICRLQRFVDGFWSYDEFVVVMPGGNISRDLIEEMPIAEIH